MAIFVLCLLTGCSSSSKKSSKTYTFTVDNGDRIKIELNTSNNYDLSADLPFIISNDGATLSQGTFIVAEAFEQFVDVVNSDENAVLIDSGNKDGNDYIFWSYGGTEFNYALRITGSNTGIVLGNPVSEESARECFQRLTITVEN